MNDWVQFVTHVGLPRSAQAELLQPTEADGSGRSQCGRIQHQLPALTQPASEASPDLDCHGHLAPEIFHALRKKCHQ